ncbi:MAG: caspase family protein [Acidobacteria bacterium]|nr:caspase family protein [Acidobacteriota bacterium]MBI3278363.1 caspase family protein [Acidobacteriota bacterium]
MTWAALLLGGALTASAATYSVTVAGLGGEPDYEQRFTAWAAEVDRLLKGSGGDVISETLQGPAATIANLRAALEKIAKQTQAQDTLVVMLIGHGSYDGVDYKFNLPGPDLTATGLAALLDRVPAGRQLVVNGTSCSGGSVHALLKPNRTVVTATKSGTEKNATVFARYWIEALRDTSSDTDKNEVISALEAFQYAERKTKQFYETQKRLATEHPSLDGGDPQSQPGAARIALLRIGSVQAAAKDPAKKALLDKRESLEQQIDALKLKKAAMPAEEYRKQLSTLLLELARTQAELDK